MRSILILTLMLTSTGLNESRAQAPASKTPSAQELVAQIQKKVASGEIKSPAELLAFLPPYYREHYVLGYDSQSPQGSSYEKPRVIVQGPQGEIKFGFTEQDPNKDHVEIMVRQPPGKDGLESYELYLADFKPGKKPSMHSRPGECLQCHDKAKTGDIDPIWEPYNGPGDSTVWKGFYGSRDDNSKYVTNFDTEEAEKLADWKEKSKDAKSHPIYSQLLNRDCFLSDSKDCPEHLRQPNKTFTENLNYAQIRKLVAKLKSSPNYEKWKYALIAGNLCLGLPKQPGEKETVYELADFTPGGRPVRDFKADKLRALDEISEKAPPEQKDTYASLRYRIDYESNLYQFNSIALEIGVPRNFLHTGFDELSLEHLGMAGNGQRVIEAMLMENDPDFAKVIQLQNRTYKGVDRPFSEFNSEALAKEARALRLKAPGLKDKTEKFKNWVNELAQIDPKTNEDRLYHNPVESRLNTAMDSSLNFRHNDWCDWLQGKAELANAAPACGPTKSAPAQSRLTPLLKALRQPAKMH